MRQTVRIGIIGDFNPELRSHIATNAAISHAASALSIDVEIGWLPTIELGRSAGSAVLGQFDGLCASPGSPYRDIEGALAAVRYARQEDLPFIGT